MLRLDGSRPAPTAFATTATVQLCQETSSAPRRFLDANDSATVRAFATRATRKAKIYRTVTDRPSYRQMRAPQSRPHRVRAVLSGTKVAAGMSFAVVAMATTAFAAGAMTHWMLSI